MKCLNCYSEYIPTLLCPICDQCGFCYYCRTFFSCIHYKEDLPNMIEKCPPRQSPLEEYKDLTPSERGWDSYKELSSILISRTPYYCFAAVLIIDESTRRGLGKSNMLILLRKLQAMQPPQNCYIDIVPTGSSDIEIMRIVSSYKAIPVFLLTSDKGLYAKLFPWAILVKSKGTSNAVRIIFNAIRYRIKRL